MTEKCINCNNEQEYNESKKHSKNLGTKLAKTKYKNEKFQIGLILG